MRAFKGCISCDIRLYFIWWQPNKEYSSGKAEEVTPISTALMAKVLHKRASFSNSQNFFFLSFVSLNRTSQENTLRIIPLSLCLIHSLCNCMRSTFWERTSNSWAQAGVIQLSCICTRHLEKSPSLPSHLHDVWVLPGMGDDAPSAYNSVKDFPQSLFWTCAP